MVLERRTRKCVLQNQSKIDHFIIGSWIKLMALNLFFKEKAWLCHLLCVYLVVDWGSKRINLFIKNLSKDFWPKGAENWCAEGSNP